MYSNFNFVIYVSIGAIVGFISFFLFGRSFLGKIYGAIIVGIIGAILGGNLLRYPVNFVTEFFLKKFNIEVFATLTGCLILIWVLFIVSKGMKRNQ